jgi:hypothetical protein
MSRITWASSKRANDSSSQLPASSERSGWMRAGTWSTSASYSTLPTHPPVARRPARAGCFLDDFFVLGDDGGKVDDEATGEMYREVGERGLGIGRAWGFAVGVAFGAPERV